jgi:hypothetical protein
MTPQQARAMYACCEDAVHQVHHPDLDFLCVADRETWTCKVIFDHEVASARAQARAEGEDDEGWR